MQDQGVLYARIYGCLMGIGIGDAMGMPTEFLSMAQIKEHFGEVRDFQAAPSWHPLAHLPKGSMTDDTEQSLAIARMLIEKPSFSVQDVADAILQWAEAMSAGDFDKMGPSTSYALKLLKAGQDPNTTGYRGNTNGAAMRVAPIGCIHPGKPQKAMDDAVRSCIPVHLTDVAIAGACAIAAGVSEALGATATVGSVIDGMLWGARHGEERAKDIINISTKGSIPWEVITSQINPSLATRMEWALKIVEGSQGSLNQRRDILARAVGTGVGMIETVPLVTGLIKLAQGEPYTAIVLAANAGGDTDSISSIVGGVCGALKGAQAFPAALLEEFESVNGVSLKDVARGLTERACGL